MSFGFFLQVAIFKKNRLHLKIGPPGPTDYLRVNHCHGKYENNYRKILACTNCSLGINLPGYFQATARHLQDSFKRARSRTDRALTLLPLSQFPIELTPNMLSETK